MVTHFLAENTEIYHLVILEVNDWALHGQQSWLPAGGSRKESVSLLLQLLLLAASFGS
jgi:hypothetical protein